MQSQLLSPPAVTEIVPAIGLLSPPCLLHQVFGKLISGDAEPTPEQEEKALLSSPEGEEKVYNVFIYILKIFISLFHFLLFSGIIHIAMYFNVYVILVSVQLVFFTYIRKKMKELSEDTHFLLMYDLAGILSNNKICSKPWAVVFKCHL